MTGIINIIKDALHVDKDTTTSTSAPTDTQTGGGSSKTAAEAGHTRSVKDVMDPRVDSDQDGSKNLGMASTSGQPHAATGIASTTGSSTIGARNTTETATADPHSTNIANRLDPTVDSSTGLTSASTHYGSTGNHHHTPTHGLGRHSKPVITSSPGGMMGIGIKAPPTGSGAASHSHAPHESALLNKLDPRVKTTDGTAATDSTTKTITGEHFDAAKHKPSEAAVDVHESDMRHGLTTNAYMHYGPGDK